MTNRHVNTVSGRLSLRKPQHKSLEILHRVMEICQPHKKPDLAWALSMIQSEFPLMRDFEHEFPSLCFALATGVGKTRLMGAFIAYLFLEHKISNFFVLAPGKTVYTKLVADFTPNTAKYVFQGISEFAVKGPTLITSENFEQRPQALDALQRDDIVINIFNISKFNEKVKAADGGGKKRLKIRRFSEVLGQSYFDYLVGLPDLVMIMDEAHRYRADASANSIEELRPVLGLELTATPQVESGGKSVRFKNIIFDYPLAQAMQDGYVKEPAVATRPDFTPNMTKAALEQLKLADGIRIHRKVAAELEVYAAQNDKTRVKPFMLVIAENTTHAEALVAQLQNEEFFDGYYKGKVILVHSEQSAIEKDENVERLLAVEQATEPTEIVVHVNMLKEGWDVTNLYTIVPLRAADSRTLVEQSMGRGLRLPYGVRTGVKAVDRLTIVAHDKFQSIVDEAKKLGIKIAEMSFAGDGEDDQKGPTVVIAQPVYEDVLGIPTSQSSARGGHAARGGSQVPRSTAEVSGAAAVMAAIEQISIDPTLVPTSEALQSEPVQKKLVQMISAAIAGQQTSLYPEIEKLANVESMVRETTGVYVSNTIGIPRVMVLPKGDVRAGFRDFTLDMSEFKKRPVSDTIAIKNLRTGSEELLDVLKADVGEVRLEDYVVRGLIDFDDVSYDAHGGLLYDLAAQVVEHLRGYLGDDADVRNVLVFYQRDIATLVHAQMQLNAWEDAAAYEVVVSRGFCMVRPQAFVATADTAVRPFDMPVKKKLEIRQMLFGGFKKCLYSAQKFDSDSERRFAVILEQDRSVIKWFKPGKNVFRIRYSADADYEPDFVVETASEKLICEPKARPEMTDPVVLAKASAAATWCAHASAHELANGGKPWRYVLIPHDVIADNMTVMGLANNHTVTAT